MIPFDRHIEFCLLRGVLGKMLDDLFVNRVEEFGEFVASSTEIVQLPGLDYNVTGDLRRQLVRLCLEGFASSGSKW